MSAEEVLICGGASSLSVEIGVVVMHGSMNDCRPLGFLTSPVASVASGRTIRRGFRGQWWQKRKTFEIFRSFCFLLFPLDTTRKCKFCLLCLLLFIINESRTVSLFHTDGAISKDHARSYELLAGQPFFYQNEIPECAPG